MGLFNLIQIFFMRIGNLRFFIQLYIIVHQIFRFLTLVVQYFILFICFWFLRFWRFVCGLFDFNFFHYVFLSLIFFFIFNMKRCERSFEPLLLWNHFILKGKVGACVTKFVITVIKHCQKFTELFFLIRNCWIRESTGDTNLNIFICTKFIQL